MFYHITLNLLLSFDIFPISFLGSLVMETLLLNLIILVLIGAWEFKTVNFWKIRCQTLRQINLFLRWCFKNTWFYYRWNLFVMVWETSLTMFKQCFRLFRKWSMRFGFKWLYFSMVCVGSNNGWYFDLLLYGSFTMSFSFSKIKVREWSKHILGDC